MAKILFVEDEPDIRDLVRLALEDVHGVSLAETAEEGLSRAAEVRPDLILMDVSLGGAIDGLEATRRLRADPRFDATPIIALTAHAFAGDRERALAAGASAYLVKPDDLFEIVSTVNSILMGNSPRRRAHDGDKP